MSALDLSAILRCPRCRGSLTPPDEAASAPGWTCPACAVRYPVNDGIADLTPAHAVPVLPAGPEAP